MNHPPENPLILENFDENTEDSLYIRTDKFKNLLITMKKDRTFESFSDLAKYLYENRDIKYKKYLENEEIRIITDFVDYETHPKIIKCVIDFVKFLLINQDETRDNDSINDNPYHSRLCDEKIISKLDTIYDYHEEFRCEVIYLCCLIFENSLMIYKEKIYSKFFKRCVSNLNSSVSMDIKKASMFFLYYIIRFKNSIDSDIFNSLFQIFSNYLNVKINGDNEDIVWYSAWGSFYLLMLYKTEEIEKFSNSKFLYIISALLEYNSFKIKFISLHILKEILYYYDNILNRPKMWLSMIRDDDLLRSIMGIMKVDNYELVEEANNLLVFFCKRYSEGADKIVQLNISSLIKDILENSLYYNKNYAIQMLQYVSESCSPVSARLLVKDSCIYSVLTYIRENSFENSFVVYKGILSLIENIKRGGYNLTEELKYLYDIDLILFINENREVCILDEDTLNIMNILQNYLESFDCSQF